MKNLALHFKHIVPWLIAAAIFAYLFHVYPPAQVFKSLTYVNLWYFSAFAVGYFLFIYVVDTWVMCRVLTDFSYKVSFKDIFFARGVTYLIMIINYPASQAAFAYYLKRQYKIPISEALGIFFFIVFVDLFWIVSLAFGGSFFQDYTLSGVDLGRVVRIFSICMYVFVILWLAFWGRWFSINIKFIERIRKRRVFHVFEKAKLTDYIKLAVMRTPIHLTIIISMYVILKTFGVSIPFVKVLSNVPLVFFIGTLPITPGGLGTTNAAMVELLYKYLTGPIFDSGKITPQELLLAATLLWMFANYLLKAITGTIFIKRVSRRFFEPTPGEPEEKIEHEASHIGGNM